MVFTGYEKQIEDLQNENERLKIIANNAIDYMICKGALSVQEICNYIGCTKEDLIEYNFIDE